MGNQENPSKFGSSSGIFIKKKVAYILISGVLASLVGVALITYYVGVDGNSSNGADGDTRNSDFTRPPKPKKITDIRLPTHLKPLSYDIRLVPFLVEGNFTIDGLIKITVDCVKGGSSNITLHAVDIQVKDESISIVAQGEESSTQLTVLDTMYDKEREFFVLKLKEPLEKGQKYDIQMKFTGKLGDNLKGFYESSFTNGDGEKEYIAVTQFQPTDARRAFPCFDEPAMKAKFKITIGRLPEKTAISNMPLNTTIENVDGYQGYLFDVFKESEPMSTYLVAMVVSSFKSVKQLTDNKAKTEFGIWARDSVIDQTDFAKDTGPKILKYFEEFFGVKYPLPKQDMIAIPDFAAGAMENWGLITYREIALLFKEGISSVRSKQKIATVISHELAHQWFGNLVTPKWWTDLWLNEGFASYVEYLGVEETVPQLELLEQFVYLDLHQVFKIDALESSHPISIPVGHPSEINEIFDKISYSKGASIIRMMDHFLTRNTLQKGLTNYLTEHQFDAAEQDDLWAALTTQAHKDKTLIETMTVKMIMDTWTLQMGYPVVTIKRDYALNTLTLNQERFLLNPSAKENSTEGYSWWIPLSFTTPGGSFENTKNVAWLKESQRSMNLNVSQYKTNKPLIFNVQETGYYRVNYDNETWEMIITELNSNPSSIHVINRAQILDDSLNLARSGRLDYKIALNTLSYLEQENKYVPWASALSGINYLNDMLKRSPAYGDFKKFVAKLVSTRYNELGYEPKDTDTHLDKLLRLKILAWACKMGNKDCLEKATRDFKQWMSNPEGDNPINVDIRSNVYCYAIAEGDETEWDFLWKQHLNSNVPSDKLTMLSALACTKKIWLLNRFLRWSIDSKSGIRKQDGSGVISAVASTTLGRDLAFDFVRDNWDKIVDYYGRAAFSISGIVRSVMADRNTKFELKELEEFQEDHKNQFSSATRTVEQAIENAKNNIAWMDSSYKSIESVLSQKN